MASIPGFRFDITGASGTQGLLSPKDSYRAYIFPRGGYASQDSTGSQITFDSAQVSARFAASNWIQVGLDISTIRQIDGVASGSITVLGDVVTVSENDRIFHIGSVQPTVVGGSATYTTPDTTIYKRDDDGSATYTNSMITSDANGLIQGFAGTNFYDCIIQDGNQSNQGSLIDIPCGVVEGVSISSDAVFGGSVTIAGDLYISGQSVTIDGQLIVGSTITLVGTSGNYSHTGTAKFGNTLTIDGAFGVTLSSVFGQTISIVGTSGNYSHAGVPTFLAGATFSDDVTVHGTLGVTGGGINSYGDIKTLGFLSLTRDPVPYEEQTISGGTITVSSSYVKVNPETGVEDTLNTITNSSRGNLLFLRPIAGGTITVAHGMSSVSDNIHLAGGTECVLGHSGTVPWLVSSNMILISDGIAGWYEISRTIING